VTSTLRLWAILIYPFAILLWIYSTDIRSVEVTLTHADIRTDGLAADNIQLEHRAFMAS